MYSHSSGRDRVLILWNILSGTSIRILPVYEGIEGAFIISSKVPLPDFLTKSCKTDGVYVASAGEKGMYLSLYFNYIYMMRVTKLQLGFNIKTFQVL